MANTKFFLDSRRSKPGCEAPILIAIRNNNTSAFINTGIRILPEYWDTMLDCVINHPQRKAINARLTVLKGEVDVAILSIANSSPIKSMTASEIKQRVVEIINPQTETKRSFLNYFSDFADSKQGRTAAIYRDTISRIKAFDPANCDRLGFDDITYSWLSDFESFLSLTESSANTRGIHLRNIRAVINNAIDNEVTTHYPFRRFKIKTEVTRKRSFDVDTLRRIFSHTCNEAWQQKYLDFFKLSFMLIGINVKDLCGLNKINAGRVEYVRAKTHKFYSIKVEKEASEIIGRYCGKKGLLLNFAENSMDYRHFYNSLIIGLKAVKEQLHLDELTTYWARHSWATIAASLDIPKETIAAALGHGGNTVTDIYISFDQKKVDEANRRVLDYVLYNKR